MRKLLIGVLVAVGLMLAQTTVRVGMLSGPTGGGRVMVIAPNGSVTFQVSPSITELFNVLEAM